MAMRLKKYLQIYQADQVYKQLMTITLPDKNDLFIWHVQFKLNQDTIYKGQTYKLQCIMPTHYPLGPPKVKFIGKIPIHQNVYGDGTVCASILQDQWSPILAPIPKIIISIMSILNQNTLNKNNKKKADINAIAVESKYLKQLKIEKNIWELNWSLNQKQLKQQIKKIQKQKNNIQSLNEACYLQGDQRIKIKINQFHPFNSIATIKTYFKFGSKKGTLFFIKDQFALTCAHNLIHQGQKCHDITIFGLAKYNDGINLSCSKFYIPKQYETTSNQDQKSMWDFAVLKIDVEQEQIQTKCGYLKIRSSQKSDFNQTILISGYPSDVNLKKVDPSGYKMLQYAAKGQLKKINDDSFLSYKITTSQGQSGSPILIEKKQGQFQAIGIHLKKNDQLSLNIGLKFNQKILKVIFNFLNQNQKKSKTFSMYQISRGQQYIKIILNKVFQSFINNYAAKIFLQNLKTNFEKERKVKKYLFELYKKDPKNIEQINQISKLQKNYQTQILNKNYQNKEIELEIYCISQVKQQKQIIIVYFEDENNLTLYKLLKTQTGFEKRLVKKESQMGQDLIRLIRQFYFQRERKIGWIQKVKNFMFK